MYAFQRRGHRPGTTLMAVLQSLLLLSVLVLTPASAIAQEPGPAQAAAPDAPLAGLCRAVRGRTSFPEEG